jgi:ankyrin repeat protein
VCQQATPANISQALRQIKAISNSSNRETQLDEVYGRAIQTIFDGPSTDLALKVLSWVSNATRPLAIEELRVAVSVNEDSRAMEPDSLPSREILADICAGLVTIEESSGAVRFTHYTTQEYIKKKSVVPERLQPASAYHALVCVTYLAFDVFGEGACEDWDDFEDRIRNNTFLEYAAGNLSSHLSSSDESRTADAMLGFLKDPGKVDSYLQARKCSNLSSFLNWDRYPQECHPLHVASDLGHETSVLSLIESDRFAVCAVSRGGSTPLHFASLRGREVVARLLIDRGADVSATMRANGATPLHLATEEGHEAVARLLIDRGADVSATRPDGVTPLHLATGKGHEAVARLLIDRGADVSATRLDGVTPLHLATREGHKAVARLLIDRGADVSAVNRDGWTPLHLATVTGHEAVARLLIDRGADVSAVNGDGWTPLHLATNEAVARLLIDRGADVSATMPNGATPLHLATGEGHEAVARLLIDRGADVSATYMDGFDMLFWASKHGYTGLIELLLELGPDPELPGGYYGSPLQASTLGGHKESVDVLLSAGASVSSKDSHGWTPLLCASLSVDHAMREKFIDYFNTVPMPSATERPQQWSEVHKHPFILLENGGKECICGEIILFFRAYDMRNAETPSTSITNGNSWQWTSCCPGRSPILWENIFRDYNPRRCTRQVKMHFITYFWTHMALTADIAWTGA